MTWTREEIREVIWCYMYCRNRVYEIRRLQEVQGHKETNKPEKLYHEDLKDERDGD
jgi:hypothetical protein